jgi:hypothetical protein
VIIHNFSRLYEIYPIVTVSVRGKYMNKTKTRKIKNRITLYRRRMKFSQRRVAMLLGHRDSSTLCTHEYGHSFLVLVSEFKRGSLIARGL